MHRIGAFFRELWKCVVWISWALCCLVLGIVVLAILCMCWPLALIVVALIMAEALRR
jgi:hypothetical protein